MSQIRPAAVADAFYPGNAQVLSRDLDAMLGDLRPSGKPLPKAIIVPHAGYIYSGPIAASAYQRLSAGSGAIKRVVLLGPAHRVPVRGLALPEADSFATPLGLVTIDRDVSAALSDLPQVVVSAAAHAMEHSLEVQLPFLQKVLGEFSLIPLVVGDASAEAVAEVIERLWGGPETVFVISSDLSHFHPYAVAEQVDAHTTQMILTLQTSITHEQACGGTPLNGLLLAAKRHGLHPELLDLRNSGDTAGDQTRVVGYGAFAFTENTHHAH